MKILIQTERFSFSIATIIVCLLISIPTTYSQKDALKEANTLFNQGRYHESLIYLSRVDKVESSGPLLFKRGVALYETNELDQAFSDFNKAFQFGYKNDELEYYLAQIKHHKGEFRQAAELYKSYLSQIDSDHPKRLAVRHLVKQCGNAIHIAYQNPKAIIENPGVPVNSKYDDFGWINSPNNENSFYFNTNRPNTVISMATGHHEIYEVQKSDNKWTKPKRMSYPINSRAEEILTGISQTGDGLIFLRQGDDKTELLVHRKGDTKGKQKKIDIAASFGVKNSELYFYNDHLVLFSADRPGGFGGMDLYASYQQNDKWTEPINLGKSINSSDDELSPFLSHDGQILYFSSNRSESIGGLDIFQSEYLYESELWSQPINLGIPINSPGDDKGFQIGDDGLTAHFASNRKNAIGSYDIYFARFKAKQAGQEYYAGTVPFLDLPSDYAIKSSIDQAAEPMEDTIIKDSVSIPIVQEESQKSPEKVFNFKPIYYTNSNDILSEENLTVVALLKSFLLEYPNVRVELIGNSNDDGIIEYNLYSSIKIAEKVKNEVLKNTAISPSRISLTGLGNNYPKVKNEAEELADIYNARIDIRFINPGADINIVYNDEIEVDPAFLDTKYELYRTIVDTDLSYKIEIAKVNQMYRGMALNLFNDSAIEHDLQTGLYSYTIGLYDNYAEVLNTKRNLERDGVVNPIVIPYINGKRIAKDDLVYYVNEYPSLKDYMNYDRSIGTN